MSKTRGIAVATLLALTSCYSFIGRYTGENGRTTSGTNPFVDWSGKSWYVEIPARNVERREAYADDLFKCLPAKPKVAERKDLNAIDRPGQARAVTVEDASAGELVFRVGFVSDVHIRQPSVKLFNDDVSRNLDNVIDSFERNGYQEAFENAVYAATVSAINQLDKRDDKPRLIINTGDATDAGTIEEAYDFAAITYHLHYPMLYALGNHDDAIFGNYKSEIGYTKNAGPAFYPVGQKERFLMYFNRRGRTIAGFSDKLVPIPLDPTINQFHIRWGVLNLPREKEEGVEPLNPANACPLGGPPCQLSSCYGIDLNGTPNQPCEKYVGYYSLMLTGTDGSPVQLIALNTTRDKEWGQWAAFDTEQRDWLASQLQQPAAVRIVFMHHRPQESALAEVAAMLRKTAAEQPLVVLSAHDHSYATEWQGFWELNAGSLEEFPQWAQLLEIRRGVNKQLYLNSRTLRPRLPVLETPPDLTALGVPAGLSPDDWDALPLKVRRRVEGWLMQQFDACDAVAKRPSNECSAGAGAHDLLIESAQCGYLGALYDHAFRHLVNPPPGPKYPQRATRTQSGGAAASRQANVVLDISAQPQRTP